MNDATLPKPTPKPLLAPNDDPLLSPTVAAVSSQSGQPTALRTNTSSTPAISSFPGVGSAPLTPVTATISSLPQQPVTTTTSPQSLPTPQGASPAPIVSPSPAGHITSADPQNISTPTSSSAANVSIPQRAPQVGAQAGVSPSVSTSNTVPTSAPQSVSPVASMSRPVTPTAVSSQPNTPPAAPFPASQPPTTAAPLSTGPQLRVAPASAAPVSSLTPPSPVSPVTPPVSPTGGLPTTPRPVTPVAPVPPVPPTTPTPPAASTSSGADKPPSSRMIKKSFLRFLPIVVGVLLVLGLLIFAASFLLNRGGQEVVDQQPAPVEQITQITYWGLWEPTTVMADVFEDFEAQNPGVRVQYVQQSHKEYRERLQTAIATGQGPDVFRFHASWVPMLRSELSPVPERVMTAADFSQTFYPIATQQLTVNQQPVGMPTMFDGLGLYYNTDIFSIANKPVPQNWEEVKTTAQDLTIRSGETLTRGGIALGTTTNVEHFSDIVGLMMLQNGADPAVPTSPEAEEALAFYMSFADTLKVWDDSLPAATLAFSRGDVAMMIAPSWRVHEVKALNANLNFEVAPVPQLPGAERITWASYWAEGVSTQSKQKELAWKLVNHLASAPIQQKLYSAAREQRAFGPIYSRVDIAEELASQPYVGAYIADAPYARSWYLNAYTHDNGINDRISKYFHDAVNGASASSLETSLQTTALGVSQVLQQYGIAVAAPAAPVSQ